MSAAAMTVAPALEIKNLGKQYRGAAGLALKAVSLSVAPGEVYGFLGPNGAGKSTTIRCLLNFLQPTSGTITILGLDSVRDSVAIKRSVGYLAGDIALYQRMTGQQFLDYMAALQPLKRPGYLRALIRAFKAELNKPISDLSKGNRQKIGLLQAFMHEPDVLILDEPTSGLDPLMQEVFFELVHNSKARGASLFISSHNLSEVRRMCDRIGFIRDGNLVAEMSMADLAINAAHTFDITFAAAAPLAALQKIKNISVRIKGDLSAFFAVLARHKTVQFEQHEADLEEEFLRLYGKEKV
jgi:ABC-2 type transport system ATP-binding protein